MLFAFVTCFAFAENSSHMDKSVFYKYGEMFASNVIIQPSIHGDSLQAQVVYQISREALVFDKSPLSEIYSSVVLIEVAFKDKDGIIRRRKIVADTAVADNYNQTKEKGYFIRGVIDVNLPYSDYTVQVNYSDSKEQLLQKDNIEIKGSSKFESSFALLAPFVVDVTDPLRLNAVKFGTCKFSSEGLRFYFPSQIMDKNKDFYCTIEKKNSKKELNWGEFKPINAKLDYLQNNFAELSSKGNQIIVRFFGMGEGLHPAGLLQLELPSNAFVPGSYKINISDQFKKDTVSFDFNVVWENMPLSLRNPDYAVETMEYILTDDEYKQMKKGSANDVMTKMLSYWKQHDPTPTTPYNEAMAEYFSRVDYAFFNFQTLSEKDGALTDRGMVHILYGKPDDIRTSMKSDKNVEIWTYKSLIKEFTFDKISSGVYKLSDIKE